MTTKPKKTEEAVPSFDFGKKKKKKKPTSTSKKPVEEEEAQETVKGDDKEEKTEENTAEEIEFSDSAKEPATSPEVAKSPKSPEKEKDALPTTFSAGATSGTSGPHAYTYEELAGRIFNLINSSRPEEKTVYKMKPPVVYREGTQKTVWVNFPEICKIMSRQPEHVLAFVLAEVGSTGSIDGSGRLVIKGKFQPKHIENILRHYISEYVKCHTCKSPETHLKKENRLLFMVCEKCGFQATTRASRRQDAKNK
jgi:translation initiation factor 2 subunit 2